MFVRELPTHCPEGHLYTEANTVLRSNGFRVCVDCRDYRTEHPIPQIVGLRAPYRITGIDVTFGRITELTDYCRRRWGRPFPPKRCRILFGESCTRPT